MPSPRPQCPSLRKLYLSNNRVVTVDPLEDLTGLETLCLYRNVVVDFHRCLAVLQKVRPCFAKGHESCMFSSVLWPQLQKLSELDLDGNPCMQKSGAKHRLVRLFEVWLLPKRDPNACLLARAVGGSALSSAV